jgi:transposase
MATGSEILLTQQQQSDLRSIAQSRALPAGYVFRAKLILMLAEGSSFNAIKRQLQTTAPTIVRWKQRFRRYGLEGLDTYHPGQKPSVLTPALRARILSATRRKPNDGSTHWSCRKLASALSVSKDAVHRVWQEAGLKPHRLERYMASDDPDFESKAADILGLYLRPPQHAAVFCVDEKTAIQALDRLDPVLPLSPGRAERHGFEYYRHGTLSLYAALNTATGRVHGKTAARHTSREFVAFLQEVVSLCPPRQQIHIILDNLSAHKTQAVRAFLQQHPRVRFHFTPTYSPGSIRSRSGSPRSNARSSHAASSPRFPTWLANSAATSMPTPPMPGPSSGNTPTPLAASAVTNSLRQATSPYK